MQHGSRHRERGRVGRLVTAVGVAAAAATMVGTSVSAAPVRVLHGKVVIGKTGSGEGRITSSPDGIDCGSRCSYSFISIDDPDAYQPVTLTAKAEPGSVFDGFGECGEMSCTIDPILPGQTYEVAVSFTRVRPSQFPLTVSVSGQGRVTSAPAGIDCGPTCSRLFPVDTIITLTAAPIPGWSFAGWSGACSGTGTCSTTMSQPRSVTATFAPPGTVYTIAVAAAGGDVTSDVPGIVCGEACVTTFGAGIDVTLTPSAGPVAWSGACSGSGACVVRIDRSRAIAASIGGASPTRAPIAVTLSGNGTVVSAPVGIGCGTTCGALFPVGQPLTLTAVADPGWVFAGWGASCRGVARTCELPARGAASVTATFVESGTRYPVAVTKSGKGTVTSSPTGLRCGARCTASFLAGQTTALEAKPLKGWTFVRWSGACRGGKPRCTLGMDGPKSVAATFARPSDRVAPRVKALPATGMVGQTVRLRYRVTDASGTSRESATVYAGRRRLVEIRGPQHAIDPGALYYFIPWRNAVAAATRFCVTSRDPTGNVSRPSCAALRIS